MTETMTVEPERTTTGTARAAWGGVALVAAWLVAAYLATIYLIPGLLSPELNLYVAQPLLWLGLGALVLGLRRASGYGLPSSSRRLALMGGLVGLLQVAVFVLAGLLYGFGYSPYARALHWVALNLVFVVTRLVGVELARWYLVANLGARNTLVGVAFVWLLLSATTVAPAKFTALGEPTTAFRAAGQHLLPNAAENLLATFLAWLGGPLAAIAYRGVLEAFEWLAPILPDLSWPVTAFLGTFVPILGLGIVWNTGREEAAAKGAEGEAARFPVGWLLGGALLVFVFWFNTGLFGVRPALITGVSMYPTLQTGDIAITRQVSPDAIEMGDIIRFKLGSSSILHRVIEVKGQGQQAVFITKGDANNVIDEPVPQSRVEGKLVVSIPKLGWPIIGIRNLIGRFL